MPHAWRILSDKHSAERRKPINRAGGQRRGNASVRARAASLLQSPHNRGGIVFPLRRVRLVEQDMARAAPRHTFKKTLRRYNELHHRLRVQRFPQAASHHAAK